MCFINVIKKHERKLEQIPLYLYLGNYYRQNGPLFSISTILIRVFQPHFPELRYPGATHIGLGVYV